MKYAQALAYITGFLGLANAFPATALGADRRQATCNSPRLRKSWDAATAAEKKAYLDAAVCLTKKPSRLGTPGSTLHDDFSITHNNLAGEIHGVAVFLPWHRYFVQVYEDALKTECGYAGPALYWDWVSDAAAPSKASIWDPILGFGGNGSSPDGSPFSYCVRDGPFKDWRPRWEGSGADRPHCLQRQWAVADPLSGLQEMYGYNYDETQIGFVFANNDYNNFRFELEDRPHSAVHAGVSGNPRGNGDLGPNTSPNDPIFFLHHTMVDRIWWQWQQEDPSRIFEYAAHIEAPQVSLDDMMPMGGLAPDRKVRDFMDTKSAELCYRYDTRA